MARTIIRVPRQLEWLVNRQFMAFQRLISPIYRYLEHPQLSLLLIQWCLPARVGVVCMCVCEGGR